MIAWAATCRCGSKRALPKVPVMVEQLPGLISARLVAVMAPPKTAYEITGKLSGDLAEGLVQSEIAARIGGMGARPSA